MARLDFKSDYICTYKNVLSKDQCQHLIDKFEDSQHQQSKTNLKGHMSFTEINLNMFSDWKEYSDIIFPKLRQVVDKYVKDVNIDSLKQWPEKFGFEQIRFKRYLPNNKDEFKEHVDVGDYASARRFLVFFLYLNSNFDGRTSFSEYDMQVYPKAGRLLMFPPTWTYLHAGFKPKLEPKYIIGSYLHYV